MRVSQVLRAWGGVLIGHSPILSIEITRECPLSCPGCYAYGENHLGGAITLRDLAELRGDALIDGILDRVRRHTPVQVSLIGGEPLMRHRELSRLLPRLSRMGVHTTVVTSGVIPIPPDWQEIPRLKVVVSVDGLQKEHDERRKPATYARILPNTEGRRVDIGLVVTQPMMERPGYLDEYLSFWSARPETEHILFSIYTPQIGETSPEMLTPESRERLISELPGLKQRHDKLAMNSGIAEALREPPASPAECTFSRMSVNYSANLETRVEPCVFGGEPDCSQCGCVATALFHFVGSKKLVGPLRASHIMNGSVAVGTMVNRLRARGAWNPRWSAGSAAGRPGNGHDPKPTAS